MKSETKTLTAIIAAIAFIGGIFLWFEQTAQTGSKQSDADKSTLKHPPPVEKARQASASEHKSAQIEKQTLSPEMSDVNNEVMVGGLTIRTFPETKLEGGLSPHVDELLTRYHSGDLEAGYILAINLRDCHAAPLDKAQLGRELESLEVVMEKLKGLMKDPKLSTAMKREEISNKYDYCKGTPKALIDQGFDILKDTAEQGSIAAQSHFVRIVTPTKAGENLERFTEQEQQELIEIRQLYHKFMNNAIEQGSLPALGAMVFNHQPNAADRNNPVKALSYNLAYLRLATNEQVIAMQNDLNQRLVKIMSEEEIAEATAKGAEIAERILKRGVVYTELR